MKPFRIDVKRFYIPDTFISAACPRCGLVCVDDIGSNYLSYPNTGEISHTLYCGDEDCGHSWDVRVRLVVKVEAVSGYEVTGARP